MARSESRSTSLRLDSHDYTSPGAYFVTICTHERRPIFGTVQDASVHLSELGLIVQDQWEVTGNIRKEVELDSYIVMPNHIHGILWIVERENTPMVVAAHCNAPLRRSPKSLGSIISGFKGAVTRAARECFSDARFMVWQPNYFEHVIRNERSLERIRRYIRNNPQKWQLDQYFTGS